jgi:hypothetical protein
VYLFLPSIFLGVRYFEIGGGGGGRELLIFVSGAVVHRLKTKISAELQNFFAEIRNRILTGLVAQYKHIMTKLTFYYRANTISFLRLTNKKIYAVLKKSKFLYKIYYLL